MTRWVVLLLGAWAPLCIAATDCRITATGTLSFGSYDVLSTTPNDSLLNVGVTCTRAGPATNVTIAMGIGPGINATSVSTRRMVRSGAPVDYLNYGLFRDSGRGSVWGFTDGVDTMMQTISVPKNGSAAATFTVYGRIAAQQDVYVGGYSDTVQITVSP